MVITFLWILCVALILLGLAGTVLPVLPGTVLVWGGIVLGAWIDDFARVGMTTVVVVSVLALLLGYWLFDVAVLPAIEAMGYQANFELIKQWFAEWDFWVVFLAGFSPIPYKLFTVTAGMMHMAVVPFMIASIISRSARFFLVAALMKWGGAKMEQKLRQYIDLIGWLCVVAAIVAYFVIKI